MKAGDLVKYTYNDGAGVVSEICLVTKVHDGRQKSVDIMTQRGVQERIWENHLYPLEVIQQ